MDIYEETVEMSTYLVAYVICDFEIITDKTAKGIVVEASARPEAIKAGSAKFGLKEAIDIINFYEDYFNVDYPLPKSSNYLIKTHKS
jgi:aminopeptidase N